MNTNDTFTNRPVTMNEKNNLLEIEEHMYILDDVKKPNVFRNMFPYSEIPKIPFNDRIVPHNMPKEIWITDTTFRDGQQSRAPYTTEQIVTIYDYLHRLGGPNGMVRACEFFLQQKGQGRGLQVYGKRVSVSGGDELDPGEQGGFPPGEGDRHEGDRYSGELLRLSYFHETEDDQKTGDGSLSERDP